MMTLVISTSSMASPAAVAEAATGMTWTVASDLPGRLRVRSEDLVASPLLRHHCKLVLTSCHWLVQFRINPLAGSLCVGYPEHRRHELLALLEQALRLNTAEDGLAPLPPAPFSGARVRRTLVHGAACLALISFESVLAVPTVVMVGLSSVLLLPLAREVLHQLRRRKLTAAEMHAYRAPFANGRDRTPLHVFPAQITGAGGWLAELERGVAGFRGPVHFIWPERDIAFRDRELAHWLRLFPKAGVTRIPACGHFLWEDAPDECQAALQAFLEASAEEDVRQQLGVERDDDGGNDGGDKRQP
jgi:pimeloyl-ACP methyl ester carboxylesterase